MLNAFRDLLCSKLHWHNMPGLSYMFSLFMRIIHNIDRYLKIEKYLRCYCVCIMYFGKTLNSLPHVSLHEGVNLRLGVNEDTRTQIAAAT